MLSILFIGALLVLSPPPSQVDYGPPAHPSLVIYGPVAPERFETGQRLTCFSKELMIHRVGFALPGGEPARVTIDGRPVAGAAVPQLISDLSNHSAEYRFGAGCERNPDGFLLRIYTVESDRAGGVRYRSGRARFRGDRLFDYVPLNESSHEGFWFR